MKATIKKVNEAIADCGVELVKGNGYFYFADLPFSPHYRADKIGSVYSTSIGCMTLEDWVNHVKVDLAA